MPENVGDVGRRCRDCGSLLLGLFPWGRCPACRAEYWRAPVFAMMLTGVLLLGLFGGLILGLLSGGELAPWALPLALIAGALLWWGRRSG